MARTLVIKSQIFLFNRSKTILVSCLGSTTAATEMLLHAEKQGTIVVKVFSVTMLGEVPYSNYQRFEEHSVAKKVQSENALTHSAK